MTTGRRHIWLCADDYGISRSVNAAIRELIMHGRLNATSVMVAAPHFERSDAVSLNMLNTDFKRAAIGLHVTLTGPFKPMSSNFRPLHHDNAFLPLRDTVRAAFLRRFHHEPLVIEIATQLRAFIAAFGRPPDFIDGHQHVHLLPQLRRAMLKVVSETLPGAWVRQCGRATPLIGRFGDPKGLFLDMLSGRFRGVARRRGVRTNPAFAGTYDFTGEPDFLPVFEKFLDRMPDGGLIMCHPGFVDAELKRLDPLTSQREKEFAFFNSDEFPRMLEAHNVALVKPADA